MIRIAVCTTDGSMAINIGGQVETSLKTFDIAAPELECYLREYENAKLAGKTAYWHREIAGVEILNHESKEG
jgi:hypothetical protein